jgi:hypothetical protein
VKALVAYIPDGSIPHETVIHLNSQALLFSLGVAVLTAILFGLVPALQARAQESRRAAQGRRPWRGGGFRRGKLRNASSSPSRLSLMLLAGAGC